MGKNTRYDKLRDRIRRKHSRSKTFEPAISFGDTELLFDMANFEDIGNDSFLTHGPFNFVHVRNTADARLRVYLSNDLEVFIDIPAAPSGPNARLVSESIPLRYTGYLRIENLSADTDVSEGDLQVQVGNQVDTVELDLLKMGGLLNVEDTD